MNSDKLTTINDLQAFLHGNQAIAYSVLGDKNKKYQFIQKILIKFRYMTCSKADKGVIKRYLMKITAYSKAQLTRLINSYKTTGSIKWTPCRSNGFNRTYSDKDLRLLVKMDEQHETPCGATVKKLCERAYTVFNDKDYQTLSAISSAHIYNLRGSKRYLSLRRTFEKTKSRNVPIGERRKPQPNGLPGYIRIDTVHQGDSGKQKGVYHINAVDEVTQFGVLCSVEKISEQFLMPVLEQLLDKFPFMIISFHSDNGSEYINKRVAQLLEKLHIEMTKSRSRHSNDNALAESKNASIVRKQFGYHYIAQKWAPLLNQFNLNYLYPYINFHRPCFFPEIITDEKGKQRKRYHYDNMMTPYEKLKSLPDSKRHLKRGLNYEILDKVAMKMTDNQLLNNY